MNQKRNEDIFIATTIRNGKRKVYVTHSSSGEDKSKEAADVILGNKKLY